jgi:hypothetical protein
MMASETQNSPRATHRKRWGISILVVLAAAVGIGALSRGHGLKTRLIQIIRPDYGVSHPVVTASRPGNEEINVLPDAFIAADVHLPNRAKAVDAATLTSSTVHLYRTGDHQPIPAVVNTSGGGDTIVLKPAAPLELNTRYTFEVTPGVKDTGGASFVAYAATFLTASSVNFVSLPIAFEKVMQPLTDGSMYTCVEVGPDHRLYASTLDGRIIRYAINSDGALSNPQTIKSIEIANGGPRLITGIKFDPASSRGNLILWVSHGQLPPLNTRSNADLITGATDWTGKISCLSGQNLDACVDYVIHLPRSAKDHLNNQIQFGPDAALYFCQGSDTAMGAPDNAWAYRNEHLLTAAMLRLDVSLIRNPPLDVKTEDGGYYDPYAPGAPLTLYATGIRNCFDILFHSNGSIYCGVNGSSAGANTPSTPADFSQMHRADDALRGPYKGPAVPGLTDVKHTQEDFLFRVEKGGYYGHPNPTRGEFVLNNGNLTNGKDPADVLDYPPGTPPDRNWRPYVFDFGKDLSPCGVIEYQSPAFSAALQHKILFVRYSGGDDIIALTPAPDGSIAESLTGIDGFTAFVNPVDLIEDPPTGNLYVAEFGGKRITLLRPKPGGKSERVCRQEVHLLGSSRLAN